MKKHSNYCFMHEHHWINCIEVFLLKINYEFPPSDIQNLCFLFSLLLGDLGWDICHVTSIVTLLCSIIYPQDKLRYCYTMQSTTIFQGKQLNYFRLNSLHWNFLSVASSCSFFFQISWCYALRIANINGYKDIFRLEFPLIVVHCSGFHDIF